ncbi:MAG: hypothetical protein DSM107014_01225 [Gomphosphaeria aponina SAG 52.96 = DSM 107014]|uniref:Uncharacterized protein n=1 Tax=Gomphosphaeria aponina SAG 52.96 = DSM 107014 TaxID=1521640 RepID=A0A941GWK0_9CHRO|nr:hypothetical protein [Gomphosphaeria aponina SAG 52.96 = DSM 107014]
MNILLLKKIKKYWLESINLQRKHPQKLSFKKLCQLFSKWYISQDPDKTPLTDQLPWITFPAIELLENFLTNDMKVFEYGSGGSTLFFARRVSEVVSVEHDKSWFNDVSKQIEKHNYNNCTIYLIEPKTSDNSKLDEASLKQIASDPDAYTSLSLINQSFRGKNFVDYVRLIDRFPDNYFDVILIDGRSRPSCFKHSLKKVKKGGYLVWDNTDQEHYLSTVNTAVRGYSRLDLPGPTPYADYFTITSLWCYILD